MRVLIALLVLAAAVRAEPVITHISPPRAPAPSFRVSQPTVRSAATPVQVLLIGDSLSVTSFGQTLQSLFEQRFGRRQFCIYASCGSSPEDWLSSTRVFVTRCGYRRYDSRGPLVIDFENGKAPRAVETPKLPVIFARYQPAIVIVQLGTNWMDAVTAGEKDEVKYRAIVRDFVREVREASSPGVRILWILPPDASRYPKSTKDFVASTLEKSARELGFATVDSRALLGRYRPGVSGGDGVHLGEEAGRRWAREVAKRLPGAED